MSLVADEEIPRKICLTTLKSSRRGEAPSPGEGRRSMPLRKEGDERKRIPSGGGASVLSKREKRAGGGVLLDLVQPGGET